MKKLLPIASVLKIVPFGKSKLYELIKLGEFPSPVKISIGRSAWLENEIGDWINERASERRSDGGVV